MLLYTVILFTFAIMRRNALLTFFVLLFVKSSAVTAEGQEILCEEGETYTFDVSLPDYIRLACPATFQLMPFGYEPWRVYAQKDAEDPVPLSSIVPGASTFMRGGKLQIAILQMPPKSTTFYMRCEGQDKKFCYIQINVEAASRLGPNTCVAAGSRIDFRLQEPGEEAIYGCRIGWDLLPEKRTHVYDASCSTEIAVPDGVIRKSSAYSPPSILLKESPEGIPNVCLVCGTTIGDKTARCEMHFSFVLPTGGADGLGLSTRGACILSLAILAAQLLNL